MKHWISFSIAASMLAAPVWAHETVHAEQTSAAHIHDAKKHTPSVLSAHVLQDIERHKGMARAHGNAAQCLAQGQSYDICQKQLQVECKGLALGKNCGMRHAH